MMTPRLISLSVASLLACSACATAQQTTPTRPPIREIDRTLKPSPEANKVTLPDVLVEALHSDAAKRSGLPADQLSIVSSEKVTWTDSALGCAQPGHMYTQALVPGYRVWIRAGERVLLYHTSESGQFVQCPTVALRPVKPDSPVAE